MAEEDPALREQFQAIFDRFEGVEPAAAEEGPGEEEEEAGKAEEAGAAAEGEAEEGDQAPPALSKKKRKAAARPTVAKLKMLAAAPEVVEVWDTHAADPTLLVALKGYRNSVPVPGHWSSKRKFLQGKRGIEKPPFQLPAFIEATGIGEMRQTMQDKADAQTLKQSSRERMRAKTGKLDIDYQVLHDAFFKNQEKPKLSQMGDVYYEGKEFEVHLQRKRPGVLSPELREALGMTPGSPPPWLISMQRWGPPPSYPNLRVPGLNAPLPPGASYGYHPGGWGKPPIDAYGQPIYGDVFGNQAAAGGEDAQAQVPEHLRQHWGQLDEEEESESEEEVADPEALEEEEEYDAAGYTSVLTDQLGGIATPASTVDLRKGPDPEPGRQRDLFHVVDQRAAAIGNNFMGSDHVYQVPVGVDPAQAAAAPPPGPDEAGPSSSRKPAGQRETFKF